MELIFEKDNLLKSVQILQGVASSKGVMPILSNILVNAQKDRIEMFASNLEMGTRLQIDGEVIEPGTIDEFPAIMSMPEAFCTIDTPTFIEMIVKTSFAASTEEVRYYLKGVYLHLTPDSTRVVAADGRRLSVAGTDPVVWSEASEEIDREERGVIVPLEAVREIRKIFAKSEILKIGFSENQIIFSDDKSTLISRLIEGDFPQYGTIIPKDNNIRIILDTKQILAVEKRVSVLANPDSLLIKFDVQDGGLSVSAKSSDFGEARDELEIKSGDSNIQIGFNAKFVMDALSHIDSEEVTFLFKDPFSAAIIQPVDDENYTYVIFPMRFEQMNSTTLSIFR